MKENRKNQREESLKILYAMFISNDFSEEFIDSYINYNNFNKSSLSYVFELLLNYLDNKDIVDNIIKKQSENYNFNRIPLIDKCIIIISITEIKYLKIPGSVSINEAVELSKIFSDTDSYKIVNSLLGKVIRSFNDRI